MTTLPRFVTCAALTLTAALIGCSGSSDDSSTTDLAEAGTAETDGGGESGESGGTEDGGETDPDCPSGEFDCPCDDGMCAAGLHCGNDGLCALGSGDGDGDPTTGGDTTTGSTDEGGTTGTPGAGGPYDPEECEAPSKILSVQGVDGEFCATPCVAESEDEDCPGGPSGTTASCAIASSGGDPDFCTLICMSGSEGCPEGSTCKDIPNQPGFGLCTFP
ncbi:hypothetical protein ENSA5_15950 [Enhygromyxa salina]|uniref:Uncharacterized protein n=1 Tax=Enhygromyxa salina TaxID=215803 RepID=A0A2S9YE91_9BACT|nr:hypothetical protein [Enhygromyxa salina]PRQ03434.1 hypothetical protein ENSA5_15950 [Enhygromyxa salina]